MLSHSNSTAGFSSRKISTLSEDVTTPKRFETNLLFSSIYLQPVNFPSSEEQRENQASTTIFLCVTKGTATWWFATLQTMCVFCHLTRAPSFLASERALGTTTHDFQQERVEWGAANKGQPCSLVGIHGKVLKNILLVGKNSFLQ